MAELAAEILEALDDLHGVHDGHRTQHAKGVLLAGTFTPTAEAAGFSRAAHFSGGPVRVTVRFSNGSGDPTAADGARTDGRGMALKFYLPGDGGTTDLVGLTLPVFFVRTGRDFLEFVRARKPDPETGQMDFAKVGAFLAAHPETQAAVERILPSFCAPVSYATCAFNSLHAFHLVAADGTRTAGRYRIEPEAGEARLSDEDGDAADPGYLQAEIVERAEREGVRFRLDFVLAEKDDDLDDPTAGWPLEQRERVTLGRLELTGVDAEREVDGDVLVFDPTRLTDGVEPTGDEIPRIRSDVYALSVLRRTGVSRTG
jgi:catalase